MLSVGIGFIGILLFKSVLGGGISEEYLYPIYLGIMLLDGHMVICTSVILEEIKDLKKSLDTKSGENKQIK